MDPSSGLICDSSAATDTSTCTSMHAHSVARLLTCSAVGWATVLTASSLDPGMRKTASSCSCSPAPLAAAAAASRRLPWCCLSRRAPLDAATLAALRHLLGGGRHCVHDAADEADECMVASGLCCFNELACCARSEQWAERMNADWCCERLIGLVTCRRDAPPELACSRELDAPAALPQRPNAPCPPVAASTSSCRRPHRQHAAGSSRSSSTPASSRQRVLQAWSSGGSRRQRLRQSRRMGLGQAGLAQTIHSRASSTSGACGALLAAAGSDRRRPGVPLISTTTTTTS